MTAPPRLRAIAPQFLVANIHRSADYYRGALGFVIDRLWGDPPRFCMPYRDQLTIMMHQVADAALIQPNGVDGYSWDAYVWLDDADALFGEMQAAGARIAYPPEDRLDYGNREFAVADPDGYLIAFGHSLAARR